LSLSLEFGYFFCERDIDGRWILAAGRSEAETYTIDDEIRVPILLSDEDGVAHVRAIFRRLSTSSDLGPRGLDPNDTLELRGNGQNQKRATVEVSIKVADGHHPGEYLCTAIQAYDADGNMEMIKNPTPSRVFRIVDERKKDDRKMEFLGWGE
jgi:hypothetical protein